MAASCLPTSQLPDLEVAHSSNKRCKSHRLGNLASGLEHNGAHLQQEGLHLVLEEVKADLVGQKHTFLQEARYS